MHSGPTNRYPRVCWNVKCENAVAVSTFAWVVGDTHGADKPVVQAPVRSDARTRARRNLPALFTCEPHLHVLVVRGARARTGTPSPVCRLHVLEVVCKLDELYSTSVQGLPKTKEREADPASHTRMQPYLRLNAH